jgi:predicted DCC family thiol-disulfide oxidoreductase YuxK
MKYFVLYAANCPACSQVARLVTGASVAGLEARPFEDAEVTAALEAAGLATPDRPSLVVVDGTSVELLSGWAMRTRLARLVGWRRSRTIARLAAAEWRARLAQQAAPRVPSRRSVIGGALAGAAGWAITSGAARASAAAEGSAPAPTAASPTDAAKALRTAAAQRAVRAWGAAEPAVLELGGANPVLVLSHPEHNVYTFIDNSPGSAAGSEPVGICVGTIPGTEHDLRYYTVDGAALADLTVADGQLSATAPGSAPAAEPALAVTPDLSKWQLACFVGCVGRKVNVFCVINCENCFYYAVGTIARVAACTQCVICAGPSGVQCLKECAIV